MRPGSPTPAIFILTDRDCIKTKRAFKKHSNDMLFSLLEAEDDYVESPILLQKITNYRANTEFNL